MGKVGKACLVWLAFSGGAGAATLRGIITDILTGEPVEAALVRIKGGSETAYSDSAGRFTLNTTTGIHRPPNLADNASDAHATIHSAEGSVVSRRNQVTKRENRLSGLPRGAYFSKTDNRIRSPMMLGKAAAAITLMINQKHYKSMELPVAAGDSDVQARLVQKNGWQLDETNTGLAGVGVDKNTLPAYTGPGTPAHGAVIRMKKITTPLSLINGNVTLDRCWIRPTSSLPGGLILTYDHNNGASSRFSSTIIDSDIDGTAAPVSVVAYDCAVRGMATVRRCNIFGMGSGIAIYGTLVSDILVERNYVHDLRAYGDGGTTGSHNESATIRGYLGKSLIFRNNRLISRSGNDSGALFIQAWAQAIDNVLIIGNLFDTDSYDIPLEAHNNGYGANMRAIDNRFVPGGYGPGYVSGGMGWAQWTENYADNPDNPDNKGSVIAKP